MKIFGLTGGIGMGKSTAAAQLAALGAKVISADAIVHALLSTPGPVVERVAALFPQARKGGGIDRKAVAAQAFGDPSLLKSLEAVLHPEVCRRQAQFLARQKRLGAKCAVVEIPLLFETGAESRCDAVIAVTAPSFVQRRRVMQRPNMDAEKFRAILARQMPDAEKRRRADFVVRTGLGKAYGFRQLKRILREVWHA